MISPVLLITFNRLEYTKKTFESIRRARPPRLYLASDGPREHIEGEDKIVREIRDWLLNNVDWECEVYTRFLDKNSGGCNLGVTGAVTWFFSKEKEGIVLEDDCVASPSFFAFCDELLDRYRDDNRIWHIAGISNGLTSGDGSTYHFSYIMNCWGWAGWADRWQYFDFDISSYDEAMFDSIFTDKTTRNLWKDRLFWAKRKYISWDYIWIFNIVHKKGFCINPYRNLITNIGEKGIHCTGNNFGLNREYEVLADIIHPREVRILPEYIYAIEKQAERESKESRKKLYKHWYEKIFSVRSRGGRYKILTLLGVQIKLSENKKF